ncbi:TerD family protein [Streptomyces sp. SJL17-1]|uniref:TerD family protein n=1 Tax=Streptomyces sp. SJL17-1 TaxID=2967223 RepID=UPI0029662079|nr:TerD family protein [Streptomyces sp. SJL17-1]
MMRGLIKGSNAFVPTAALRVAVRSGVDVAALLVTEHGRVRGDSDIVFDGAPAHTSGAVRLTGTEDGTVWLDTDLTSAEETITRVLLVASTEEGALRDAHGLSVEVLGPDGSTVVTYEVTDAGDETAMVLAELYRRSGGWKFRAVGQGYVDGLTGLARDHGVDVSEDPRETPAQAPAPVTSNAPVAAQAKALATAQGEPEIQPQPHAPAPAPAPIRRPTREELLDMTPDQIRALAMEARASAQEAPDAPAPSAAPAQPPHPHTGEWRHGSDFSPRKLRGRENDVITLEGLPPGVVLVELDVTGRGYTGMWPLDSNNQTMRYLVNSTIDDFRGRVTATVPEDGRLRLKLNTEGEWRLRVAPLSTAPRLKGKPLKSNGPDVLRYTGGPVDVVFDYEGDGNFIVHLFELAEQHDRSRLPERGTVAVNEIGRRKETVPLPAGPLVLRLPSSDGPWSVRLKNPGAYGEESYDDGGVGVEKLLEPRKVLSWLRRGRH